MVFHYILYYYLELATALVYKCYKRDEARFLAVARALGDVAEVFRIRVQSDVVCQTLNELHFVRRPIYPRSIQTSNSSPFCYYIK